MEITFNKYTDNTHINTECSESTAVKELFIIVKGDDDEVFVGVTYRSGDKWRYFVPASIILANLGMESVGRFVATVVKPNATFADSWLSI
jgi:predicted cupin superfamily sugar epimerase